jgi:hypothetical protein
MKLFIVILTALLCGVVASLDASKDTINIDPLVDVTTIKPNQKENSETSGDDEGSGDMQADSSGSGSGAVLPTVPTVAPTVSPKTKDKIEENVVNVKVIPTKSTTESETVNKAPTIMTEKVQEMTTMDTVVTTVVSSDTDGPTEDEFIMGGGVAGDGVAHEDEVAGDGNIQASKQDKEGLRVLTKEVIAAVIVGGICAIILIAFLVYRLRKRDEGSYILTDSAYKDTNKLRGDPGKEAFV